MRYTMLMVTALIAQPVLADTEAQIEFYSRVANSVVKIEAHNTNGRVSIGSGVMIGEGIAATNCHVTRYAKSVEVIKGGLSVTAETQTSDLERDVCILNAPGMTAPIANLAQTKPRLGQEVVALGYIGGLGPRLSSGEVISLYEHRGSQVIESTAAFTSGASGGGLFDKQGNLLGLVTFFRRGNETPQHFSVPLEWIRQVMQTRTAEPIASLGNGSPFWQKPAANQPYFLRAATLRADGQAESLRSLAQSWAEAETNNADAWFMLGNALHDLGRNDDAIDAYRKAIANDLDHSGAWFSLGVAYMRARNTDETESVMHVLKSLDDKLVAKLMLEKIQNCFENGDEVTC